MGHRTEPSMRKTPDNSKALAAFVAHKAEIDTTLARLTALSSDHFSCAPDTVTWGDVGTLASYLNPSLPLFLHLPQRSPKNWRKWPQNSGK